MNALSRRRIFLTLLSWLLSVLVGASGCSAKEIPKGDPPKTVVILVDLSASAVASREDYLSCLDKVFGNIRLGDHLFIAKITDRSEMESRPILDNVFHSAGEKKNEYVQKQANRKAEKDKEEALKKAKDEILKYLNGSAPPTPATAIMGSLQVAARIFQRDAGRRGVLVILSDMMEATRDENFERIRLDSNKISNIIAREKRNKRIPDLKGVKVYVAGARSADRDRYYQVLDFWLRYFQETGGILEKKDYGGMLEFP